MFGLGLLEIVVIVLVTIILVNPKDLPAFFRKAGRLHYQFRQLKESFIRGVQAMEHEQPA